MTLKMKAYFAAAAGLVVLAVGAWAWSEYRIARLEEGVRRAKTDGEEQAALARELEAEAAGYRKKIEYQEEMLSELKRIAAAQDEEIEIIKVAADDARGSVRRARAVERLDVTTAELCGKLAQLGHPCE